MGVNCLDGKIKRDSKPVSSPYELTLKVEGHSPVTYKYSCEEYYGTQCSVRGNGWAYRQVEGMKPPPHLTFQIGDDEISLKAPNCREIHSSSKPDYTWFEAKVNGISMYIVGIEDGKAVLKAAPTNSPESKVFYLKFDYEFYQQES
ncbi:hypothetical protein [Shewanella maritima]|uniref:hypothetical protein n=1 Tax=Shewanella maritima TaxID=2520507 RepID=UPI003736E5C1